MFEEIVEYYTARTEISKNVLQIVGTSPFTKALERRCNMVGVKCWKVPKPTYGYPVVIDHEISKQMPSEHADIDLHFEKSELSACAEAILKVCDSIGVAGKVVCIVGRGKAVQGLAKKLLAKDATVTVCHSKTNKLLTMTAVADVLILAAPECNLHRIGRESCQYIIDVAGKLGYKARIEQLRAKYISASDIGRITTAILAYRASIWEG